MSNVPSSTKKADERFSSQGQSSQQGSSHQGHTAHQGQTGMADRAAEAASGIGQKARDAASAVVENAGNAATFVGGKASEAATFVGHKAQDATTAMGNRLESLGQTIREHVPHDGALGQASSAVANTLENTGRYLQHEGLEGIASDMTNLVRRNPIPAIFVALGVGFLLAKATSSRS